MFTPDPCPVYTHTVGGNDAFVTFHFDGYNDSVLEITPTIGVPTDTPECFASHIGVYAILPHFLEERLKQVKLKLETERPIDASRSATTRYYSAETGEELIEDALDFDDIGGDKVAVIPFEGAITKKRSKFAEASAIEIRKLVRTAANDPQVSRIVLKIDSPGGAVSGIDDLAFEVREAAKKKPVIAFIEDLGASAAYWVASQATEIVSNNSAFVGSLGVYGVLYDTSEQMKREGIEVHVVSSGGVKGAGVPGTKITKDVIADEQRIIDAITEIFKANVAAGRDLSEKEVTALFDGRIHPAKEAIKLGLVDRIDSLESTFTTKAEEETMPEDEDKKKKKEDEDEEKSESELDTDAFRHDDDEDDDDEDEDKKKKEKKDKKGSTPVDEFAEDVAALALETKKAGCFFSVESITAKLIRAGGKAETPDEALTFAIARSEELKKIVPSIGSMAAPEDSGDEVKATVDKESLGDKWKALIEKVRVPGNALLTHQAAKKANPKLLEALLAAHNPSL